MSVLVVPSPFECGRSIGAELVASGVSLRSILPLTTAARRAGYSRDWEIRGWIAGLIDAYATIPKRERSYPKGKAA